MLTLQEAAGTTRRQYTAFGAYVVSVITPFRVFPYEVDSVPYKNVIAEKKARL